MFLRMFLKMYSMLLKREYTPMDYLKPYRQARENIKPYLLDYVKKITTKSKGKNMFVCPICGSGTGKDKSGAFSVRESNNTYTCFSCGRHGDIINLYRELNRVDQKTAEKALCAMYDVSYPNSAGQAEQQTRQQVSTIHKPQAEETEIITDFTDFFRQAQEHIKETDYPQKRGLSDETIKRFRLGFVKDWKHPKKPRSPTSPRLIVPISEYSYLARDTREYLTGYLHDMSKLHVKGKEGARWIFNSIALTAADPVFVVEGEIDALSIIEVGGNACGLGSIANIKQFLKEVAEWKPKEPLIICLDNDTAGQQAQAELVRGLESLKVPFYKGDINGRYKDANEHLTADRTGFIQTVKQTITDVKGA